MAKNKNNAPKNNKKESQNEIRTNVNTGAETTTQEQKK